MFRRNSSSGVQVFWVCARMPAVAPRQANKSPKSAGLTGRMRRYDALNAVETPDRDGRTAVTDPFMEAAVDEARQGRIEGGIPIGSVLIHQGRIIGRGHNRRVQRA